MSLAAEDMQPEGVAPQGVAPKGASQRPLKAETVGSNPIGGTASQGSAEFEALMRSWFLKLRVEGCSTRTTETHHTRLRAFQRWLQGGAHDQDPRHLTRAVLEGFLLDSLEVSASCANDRFRTLRAWCNYLVAEGELQEAPTARLRAPRLQVLPPPVLSSTAILGLLRATQGAGFYPRRDHALVRLWLDTGLRCSEVAGLTLDRLDLVAQTVTVVGKGNKVRVVPFGAKAALALDRYLRVRGRNASALSSQAVFLGDMGALTRWSLAHLLHRLGHRAGVPELHSHLFRHTLAHNWLLAGGGEGDLMRLMGWSSRSMLDRYGAAAAAQRAQQAHRRLSPGDQY